MWKFSNLNSACNLWPPDAGQNQNSIFLVYPTYANPSGCFSRNAGIPFPGFGAQDSSLHLNSAFILPQNTQPLNPINRSSGLGATTAIKRLLVFDHSGDQKGLICNSAANPYLVPNSTLPASNETYVYASNCQGSEEEREEMHEDTEEIDALLYSDSEYSFDSEEASTGHSPFEVEEEEVSSSPIPAKRRRLDLSELDTSLVVDTASSASAPSHHYIPSDDDEDLSYVNSGSIWEGKPGEESKCSKRERIQLTVDVLRKIIPCGEGKDTAAVLDEAICYLKTLKLQAKAVGAATSTFSS